MRRCLRPHSEASGFPLTALLPPPAPLCLFSSRAVYQSRYSGTEMVNPDFAQLARAMGGKGLTLEREAELESVVREFLFADPEVPTLLNAVCETDEHVFPMVPAGNALHDMVLGRPGPAATAGAGAGSASARTEGPACRTSG